MENSLRIGGGYLFHQLIDASLHSCRHSAVFRYLVAVTHKEDMQLTPGGDGILQWLLAEAPGLGHQATHPVTVHRMAEAFFRYREAHLYGRPGIGSSRDQQVNEPDGKNRKRFPRLEKRVNMLLPLEPLIYFESMTNGHEI